MLFVMQSLNHLLPSLGSGTTTATYNVDSCLAEVEDLLSYCNDILCTGIAAAQVLPPCIFPMLVYHMLAWQVYQAAVTCTCHGIALLIT